MHECKICNKQYKTAANLAIHNNNVHSNIIYHCDICNKFSTKNKSGFTMHKKKCKENQLNNVSKDCSNVTTDIFINNKYSKLYFKIIQSVTQKELTEYCENHHIIPKSLGGSDDKSNIIRFSARKHFLCHYLLTKMVKKNSNNYYKMVTAFNMMSIHSTENRYINSRLFAHNKAEFSKTMSKNQSGEFNSNYGKIWIHNPETADCILIKSDLPIPKGYIKGRYKQKNYKKIFWVHNPNTLENLKLKSGDIIPKDYIKGKVGRISTCEIYRSCKKCNNEFIINGRDNKVCNTCKLKRVVVPSNNTRNLEPSKQYAIESYKIFKSGNYKSIREFCRSPECSISIQAQARLWKKYIPEHNPRQGLDCKSN